MLIADIIINVNPHVSNQLTTARHIKWQHILRKFIDIIRYKTQKCNRIVSRCDCSPP